MRGAVRTVATPTLEREKIQALEGLRGVMAAWVMLGHVSLTFDLGVPLIDQNTLPVDVFIILSGFVIFRLIDLKREPYPQYLARRAFRIFPLYLLVLLASAALLWIQLQAMTDIPFQSTRNLGRLTLARAAIDHLPQHLLAHLPLFQGLVPDRFLPLGAYAILGQSWSVSMEWQFYIVAPLAFAALARRRWWIVLAVAIAALVFIRVHVNDAFLGAKVLHFALGGGSYFLINRCPPARIPVAVLVLIGITVLAAWPGSRARFATPGVAGGAILFGLSGPRDGDHGRHLCAQQAGTGRGELYARAARFYAGGDAADLDGHVPPCRKAGYPTGHARRCTPFTDSGAQRPFHRS